MSNAAIFMHPEAFDTSRTQLMGRHSAGEGFLKGFIRHADVDRFHFWNAGRESTQEMEAFVQRLQPTSKPIQWYGRGARAQLQAAGAVSIPSPKIAEEAWFRRSVGDNAYGICGLTHTTATARVTDALAELLTGPVQPWDALICTSRAVRASVETQIELVSNHLEERLGATKRPSIRLETVPLGVDVSAFKPSPEERRRWRAELDIPDDGVVALYVGRFNLLSKMNPVPMALALEQAAQRSKRPIYWVVSGWAATEDKTEEYHEISRSACPSVHYRTVDGRRPDVRFSIWSAADFFLSLSDNIQETFGLTPVEAMAAGLPSVISDWNGYRDTVRHGVDGFRASTYTPRSGLGGDLAFRHSVGWDSYDGFVGAVSQFTAVDVAEAAQAIVDLVKDPALRQRMGDSARRRAQEVFDWSAVIPQYQALWSDMAALRPKLRPQRSRGAPDNPWRLDPYRLFSSYPSEQLTSRTLLSLAPGVTRGDAAVLRGAPIVKTVVGILPPEAELERIIGAIGANRRPTMGNVLSGFPQARRPYIERCIVLLAKYGLVEIQPSSSAMHNP
jgi:glycosyltransferase involved in cell wall biosynthesis